MASPVSEWGGEELKEEDHRTRRTVFRALFELRPDERMVQQLVELEYLEEERDFEAPRNRPIRYRAADPAQRFYYGMVLPNESAIASSGALAVWQGRLARQVWPTYVGKEVFEDVGVRRTCVIGRNASCRRSKRGVVGKDATWTARASRSMS